MLDCTLITLKLRFQVSAGLNQGEDVKILHIFVIRTEERALPFEHLITLTDAKTLLCVAQVMHTGRDKSFYPQQM